MIRALSKLLGSFFGNLFGSKKQVKLGLYGPPNGGKTTLANRISGDWLGEEVGSVSNMAHETREIQIKEKITIKSTGKELSFSLVDTPGIATKIDYEEFLKFGMKEKEAKGAQNTSKGATDAQDASKKTGESAQIGSKAAAQVSDKMDIISVTTKEGAAKIKALGEKSQEIGKIVETINNISEQTNLLALNAAIEAARAGDAGRGFAVVADEVRKLAEESGKATGQISDLIGGIQNEIQSSVESMDKNTKQVDEGAAAVQEAVKSFETIPELVEDINRTLAEMSAVAQENAAGSEEVSSSVEQITSSMQQVNSSAQVMSAGAEELKQLISKFKVNNQEEEKPGKKEPKKDIPTKNAPQKIP